jgi:hypothetical protein
MLLMCTAIALIESELPESVIEQADVGKRIHCRGGDPEVRFHWGAAPSVLPVWWHGQLRAVNWGNHDRHESRLPVTGWTWEETVKEGKWLALSPEPVVIPATYGFAEGVWYRVKQGMQGLLVLDQREEPVVYMLCKRSTRYYEIMTRSKWMPVLVGEVI